MFINSLTWIRLKLLYDFKGSHNQQKSGEGSRGRADIVSVQTPDFSQPPPIKSDSNSATPQWSSNQVFFCKLFLR